MNVGILGSGVVDLTFSARLAELGQDVMIDTGDVARLLARTEPGSTAIPPFAINTPNTRR